MEHIPKDLLARLVRDERSLMLGLLGLGGRTPPAAAARSQAATIE